MSYFILNKKLGAKIAGITAKSILVESALGKFQIRNIDVDSIKSLLAKLQEGVEVPDADGTAAEEVFRNLCLELSGKKLVLTQKMESSVHGLPLFFEKLGLDQDEFKKLLGKKRTLFISDLNDAPILQKKLQSRAVNIFLAQNLEEEIKTENYDLAIVLVKDPSEFSKTPLYKKIHQNVPTVLHSEVGYFGYVIGPVFKSKAAPCLSCLCRRRNESNELKLQHIDEELIEQTILDNLFNELTLESLRILAERENLHLLSGLFSANILHHTKNYHEIWPTPFCEVCYEH